MNEENTLRLIDGLQRIFEFDDFKSSEQRFAAEAIYSGHDNVVIRMPRGSGKSLCYQLPIVLKENSFALVFSPRVSYVKKQVRYLLSRKIPSLYWGTNKSVQNSVKREIKSGFPLIKLFYLTPHQHTIQKFQYIAQNIKPGSLAYVVLDECHCFSRHSLDFREDYQELYLLKKIFPDTPFILVDSTLTHEMKHEIYQTLKLHPSSEFLMPVNQNTLFHDVWFIETLEDPVEHLSEFIKESLGWTKKISKENQNCGIIFCRNKSDALSISQLLLGCNIPVQLYRDALKTEPCLDFLGSRCMSTYNLIIITPCYGVKINQKSIRFVVHWGPPKNIENYYQLSSCAGHDGIKSYFRVYLNSHDVFPACTVTSHLPHKNSSKDVIDSLLQIQCRHSIFSKYFDNQNFICENSCDVCVNPDSVQRNLYLIMNLKPNKTIGALQVKNPFHNSSTAPKSSGTRELCGHPPPEHIHRKVLKELYKTTTNRNEKRSMHEAVKYTSATRDKGESIIAEDVFKEVLLALNRAKEEPSSPILFSSEENDCENIPLETLNTDSVMSNQGSHFQSGDPQMLSIRMKKILYKSHD